MFYGIFPKDNEINFILILVASIPIRFNHNCSIINAISYAYLVWRICIECHINTTFFYIKETHINSFRNLSNLSEHITAVTHISKHHRFKLSSHILYRLRNKTFKLSSDISFLICKIYSFFYQNTYLPLDRFNMLLTFYINIRHFVSSINIIKYNNH